MTTPKLLDGWYVHDQAVKPTAHLLRPLPSIPEYVKVLCGGHWLRASAVRVQDNHPRFCLRCLKSEKKWRAW